MPDPNLPLPAAPLLNVKLMSRQEVEDWLKNWYAWKPMCDADPDLDGLASEEDPDFRMAHTLLHLYDQLQPTSVNLDVKGPKHEPTVLERAFEQLSHRMQEQIDHDILRQMGAD